MMKTKIFFLMVLCSGFAFAEQNGSCSKEKEYSAAKFHCWYGAKDKNNILKITEDEIQMGIQDDKELEYVGQYDDDFINVFFLGQNDWAVGGSGIDIFYGYEGKDELWGRGAMDKFYSSGELRLPDYEAGERINEIIDVSVRDKK